MSLRNLAVAAFTVALCGCSASIPVTHIDDKDPVAASGEGTLLVLPRTALTLKYALTSKAFTAGTWTREIEVCEDVAGSLEAGTKRDDSAACGTADAKTCRALKEIRGGHKPLPQTCVLARDLGLSSKRLSRASGALQCAKDGDDGEFRAGFDADALAVSATPVPDPKQVYWVATPVKTFGDATVKVSYSDRGTVTGAKAVASNPFLGFALDVAGIATKAALATFGADEGEQHKAFERGTKEYACLVLQGADCIRYGEALAALNADIEKRAALLGNPSLAPLVAAIDADIEKRKALFTGTVAATSSPRSVTWLPPYQDTDPSPCEKDVVLGAPWPHSCGKITVPACSKIDDPPTEKPEHTLTFQARRAAESEEWIAVVRPTLQSTAKNTGENGRKKDRGFPYRVPALADVTAKVTKNSHAPGASATPAGSMTPAQQYVAQFGEVGRLTPRAGGRTGTIDVSYYGDTGALSILTIDRTGADPKPILDPIKEALTPKTELDALKAEKDRLTLLKDICLATKELSKPLPDFCKQLVPVPEA